ncbi:hypothetical protein ACSTIX_24035, partial [Vibrio parahaemolyticus]
RGAINAIRRRKRRDEPFPGVDRVSREECGATRGGRRRAGTVARGGRAGGVPGRMDAVRAMIMDALAEPLEVREVAAPTAPAGGV